ncbi:hypothetical protein OPT61_g6475 [Boeremia exigua]|uniref:Uncharacterized protein n=1 Tax=Boeremia exigua TaxID=749465 RepID=A0ACC2I6G8_9PLEO|nr:hypothetical protein OPT61_g6475 [Boeremia exigua]
MPRSRGGSATSSSLLRLIDRAQKLDTLFILVAGIGTKVTDEWTDDAGNLWLASVQAPGIGLYSYDHNIGRSDQGLWKSLIDHGQRLLQEILSLIEDQHLQHCPILLVAHSLGGFIVKETLRLVYVQASDRYKSFKKSMAGVILMGTPHSISEGEGKWQNVAILPQVSSFTFKPQPLDRDSIERLTQSSLQFDQSGVDCPILTVCEGRPTKVKQGFGAKRIMLVDKSFARTESLEERCVEVDSNHRNLCNISDNVILLGFIDEVLEDARLRIASESPKSRAEAEHIDDHGWDMAGSDSNPTTLLDPPTNSATAGSSDLGFELVREMTSDLQLEVPVLPCYLIPIARNKNFFGRQDVLDQIHIALPSTAASNEEESEFSKSFVLCGPGGIGKTQIVTEYAYRCRDMKTFDAIFWINADGQAKLAEGIAQIATSLNLVAADSPEALDPVITANLTKEWLSNPARSAKAADDHSSIQPRWLLILDNVDDLGVLEGFWPVDGPGCILITSRDPLAKEPAILADAGCEVGSFSSEESSKMLIQLTKRTGDGRGVGDRLGGFPLALVQMASVIIRNHMSFEEFVETWDERQEHPEYLGIDSEFPAASTYGKSPSTIWAIDSLRHGKPLLDVMAFYDPDNIQEFTLKQYSLIDLEGYPTNNGGYLKARRELLQTSLAQKDARERNLSVHRIVQDATRSRMEKNRYHRTFTAALHLLVSAWPFEEFGWRHGVARWRKCDELFPHVLRMKGFGCSIAGELESLATKIKYCKLMNDAGWFYHETGHFTESFALIEHAYDIANATLLSQSQDTHDTSCKSDTTKVLKDIIAEMHHNLGCIGTETNQPELTLFHFKKFNSMMLEGLDTDIPSTVNKLAISWNELGNAYMINKHWGDGERCFEQCLKVAQQMESFNPAEFSFPYVNLGLAYWLTDRLDLAQGILEEGLRHREARYGYDDDHSFITGRFLYALGNVAASKGALQDSVRYHDRALRQFLATIGKNHHRTGDVRIRVAEHQLRLSNFEQATEQIDGALAIFRERTTFKPELARATFLKSRIRAAAGDSDEAHRLRNQSFDMFREVSRDAIPHDHELTWEDFNDLVAFWSR